MSTLFIASCACGYQGRASTGATRRTAGQVAHFPALCARCAEVVTVDLLSPQLKCPTCHSTDVTPYSDEGLWGALGSNNVDNLYVGKLDRVFRFHNGTYLCPACKSPKLRFTADTRYD